MMADTKLVKTPTAIHDVFVIEPRVFADERGWFNESFNAQDFASAIQGDYEFVQDNHSFSRQWTLRGLHYQMEKTQGKLVRVVSGTVFDVAVDIRTQSPSYGKWAGVELSAENHQQMWIPPGLAHGFLVLTSTAGFLYKTTDYYDPTSEVCLAWDDPAIGIDWPLPEGVVPNMNMKDLAGLPWDRTPKF
jgi:dTDP-4-dehydrorhamnose 3,5-epimerase